MENDNLLKFSLRQNLSYDPELDGVSSLVLADDDDDGAFEEPNNPSNSEKFSSFRYNHMINIKDELTAPIPSLKTIPLVGMGGIGKTTLTQSIYESTEILYHFHVRAWVTISQEYELRNVLLCLLRSMGSIPNEIIELGDEYFLAERLYRGLKGRRYLIVLDDVWSTNTWNELKGIVPNDKNGSRIILTTRDAEVAAACAYLGSPPFSLECLSIDESWRLLCNKLFVGKPCPPDLVEIGKEIANGCQGLPLAIVVVAGILSKIDMNRDCWTDVEEKLASLLTKNQEQFLDILCLSYNYLPQHLRACFLYMGVFPQNSEILVTSVIRSWCAAGFLNAEYPESIEGKAGKCMEQLISRNLIIVKKKKYDGTAKTCGIHDFLWDLILRQAQREGQYIFGQSDFWRQPHPTPPKYSISHLTSSFVWQGCLEESLESHFPNYDHYSLLKVLLIPSVRFLHFPNEITQIVNLTYLELFTCANIPASISNIRNLETLIHIYAGKSPILPIEIWLLKRLRHLHVGSCTFLPNIPSDSTLGGTSFSILQHLQTLSVISFASCTEQALSSIPNLKQLKIHETGEDEEHLFDYLNNLSCLSQLQELNVRFCTKMRIQTQIPCLYRFPQGIKKLTLRRSHLPWEYMDILAMLPNLEELKLKRNAFKGPVYEQTQEFCRLKLLQFENLDLEHWITDTIYLPVLQCLVVKFCKSLNEIPSCIGEIPTLKCIRLFACSISADWSARAIRREQWDSGNNDLRVCIEQPVVMLHESFFGAEIDQKIKQVTSDLPDWLQIVLVNYIEDSAL